MINTEAQRTRRGKKEFGASLCSLCLCVDIFGLAFSRAIGLSPMRISHVNKGTRPVTAELALLFGPAFKQSLQYWLNLQAGYVLKTAEASIGRRLRGFHAVTYA
jgi:addiction module HigA family antidote